MAALESGSVTEYLAVQGVEWHVGEGGARVIVFKELAEVFLKECLDNNASGRTLTEMGFALRVCFATAARDRLGWVDLVARFAHWQKLEDVLGSEFLAGARQFPKSAVMSFPVDGVDVQEVPPAVDVEEVEHCRFCRRFPEMCCVLAGDVDAICSEGHFARWCQWCDGSWCARNIEPCVCMCVGAYVQCLHPD
jgi:hypothetical protein